MNVASIARRSRAFVAFTGRELWLRGLGQFATGRAHGTFPATRGEKPVADSRGLLFAGMDGAYFETYGAPLLRSLRLSASPLRPHFHLYDPTPELRERAEALREEHEEFSWSWEQLPSIIVRPQHKTIYYQAARFVRMAELVEAGHMVYAIDADSVIRHCPISVAPPPEDADVGLFFRPTLIDPGKRVLAACVMARPTEGGRAFLRLASDMIVRHLMMAGPTEKLDQLCLFAAYRRLKGQVRFWQIPPTLADWRLQPDSAIWSGKGKAKQDRRFVMEQRRYHDAR